MGSWQFQAPTERGYKWGKECDGTSDVMVLAKIIDSRYYLVETGQEYGWNPEHHLGIPSLYSHILGKW